MPIKLGGVPTGVHRPPIDAPHATPSTCAERKRASARESARAIGSTTAVAAALEIHIDNRNADVDTTTSADNRLFARRVSADARRAPNP